MIKAVVGAGGKTTLIRRYAAESISRGLKVFVTTSTHMYIEEDTLLTDDADEIIRELNKKHYVMAGIREGEKIKPLSMETYHKVCAKADVVLIEADGSKHMPIKFPGEGEPVIYDNVDEIIVVYGIHALNKRAREVCHRLELVKKCLDITDDTLITEEHMQKLVVKGYVEPLRAKFPEKRIVIQPMGHKIGCVIMASGESKRFGQNKLLAEYEGKTFIQRIIDITDSPWFTKRVVVTRSEEVRRICDQRGIDVIYHTYPGRNDTVRLGIESMAEMDGCLFCSCDQPLLQRISLENLIHQFIKEGKGIFRLSYNGKHGMPILFGREFYEELSQLPFKCGGSHVVKMHPNEVRLVNAENELELFDVDTPKDYEWLVRKCVDKEK